MRHDRQSALGVNLVHRVGHRAKDPWCAIQEQTHDVVLPSGRDLHPNNHINPRVNSPCVIPRTQGPIYRVVVGHGQHINTQALGNRNHVLGGNHAVAGRRMTVQLRHAPAARRRGRRISWKARPLGPLVGVCNHGHFGESRHILASSMAPTLPNDSLRYGCAESDRLE